MNKQTNKESKAIKEGSAPAVVHSEKGEGFHNFFKEQVQKVRESTARVEIVSSPLRQSKDFLDNYDLIKWKSYINKLNKII